MKKVKKFKSVLPPKDKMMTAEDASKVVAAIPWASALLLLKKFGGKILPIVIMGIAEGETLQEIVANVVEALGGGTSS